MSSRHPFDRFDSSCEEGASLERDRAAWRQHVWSCRPCREEAVARQGIERAAKGTPMPRLSSGFDARLFARLQREDAPRRLPVGARRWLAAYWVAAAVLSFYIARRTETLTVEGALYSLAALVLVWGVLEMLPSRVVRRAAALLGG